MGKLRESKAGGMMPAVLPGSYKLAKDLGISATALGKILSGKHRMSMDTCWRLARYFGVSRNYFFNIQADIEERNNSDSFGSETKGLPVYNWG